MEKTASQKIQLGLFVLIGLMVFVVAVYFIGDKQKMFGKTNHLTAVFNNVNGLELGNNVRYSGINVGTVRGIEMISDTAIQVDMIIDKTIFSYINQDAVAIIGSDGLVGNMVINIIPGKGDGLKVKPGDKIKSMNRIRTDDMLNTLGVTNKNAANLTADLLKITNDINNGKGTIGLLVRDTVLGKDLKETMRYIRTAGKGTSELVTKLNNLVSSLDQKDNLIGVIKDSAVANDVKTIIRNLEKSSSQIDKVVNNLNNTILNVKDGKGSLNYLANDPELVRKIDSTMTNINQASFRLNEDLEALKHNFLFRGYFKKQEKARLKEQKKESDKKY